MDLLTPVGKINRSLKMYASRIEKLEIKTLEDFLYHFPSRYEDYSLVTKIALAQPGETVTIQGQVLDMKTVYMRGGRIKTMQKATVIDETGSIELTWFNQPFLTRAIETGSEISASGRVGSFGKSKKLSLQSPQYEILSGEGIHTGRLVPIYPETHGVTSKWIRRQMHALLTEHADLLQEFLPPELVKKNELMAYAKAMQAIHFPQEQEEAEKARERLAFDELFLMQLRSNKRRAEWNNDRRAPAVAITKYKKKLDACISSLPFELTKAQHEALENIFADLQKSRPMNRLLQGDVGSGKTIVAAVAMYALHLSGFQSVLMAPTEILATQHFSSIAKLLEPLDVRVGLITGSKKSEGNFDILIGTHALLSEKVSFSKLGLVVIDEQQRFGVAQRGLIKKKGDNPHLLTMTATPIPRTVALTMYGDLHLSYLYEMPHGRKRVKTWLTPTEKRDSAYAWIRKQIKETDSQVFVICPFIEPSETMQTVKAVKDEFLRLESEVFPDLKLGLLHGKQKAKEKETILAEFKDKKFDILVATPVVEVGIDIPNATVIVIEASERFGLAQLHQLRGRVGRSDKQSYCLLFTESKSPQTGARLRAMETVYSGAELAEIDLKMRGPGNLYGTAQHGIPSLKAASFSDTLLIQKAKAAADIYFVQLADYPLLADKIAQTKEETISPD